MQFTTIQPTKLIEKNTKINNLEWFSVVIHVIMYETSNYEITKKTLFFVNFK